MFDEDAILGDLDVCKYALTIEGVLTKPSQYYTISNNDKMEEAVIGKGIDMMSRIGVSSNITVTAPLVQQVK